MRFSISFFVLSSISSSIFFASMAAPMDSNSASKSISKSNVNEVATSQQNSRNFKDNEVKTDSANPSMNIKQKDRNIQSLFDRNADLAESLGDNDYYNPWAYIYPGDTLLTVMVLKSYQLQLKEIKVFYDVIYAKKDAEKAEEKAKKDLEKAKEMANSLIITSRNKIKETEDSANNVQSKLEDDIKGKLIKSEIVEKHLHQASLTKSFKTVYEAKTGLIETARLANWQDPTRFPPQQIRIKPYHLKETVEELSKYFEYKDIAKFWKKPK